MHCLGLGEVIVRIIKLVFTKNCPAPACRLPLSVRILETHGETSKQRAAPTHPHRG